MKTLSQRTALVGLVVGVLAIPALVLASTAVLESTAPSADEVVRTDASAQAARSAVEIAPEAVQPGARASQAVQQGEMTEADLVAACGPDGSRLVELEAIGDISPLEQAALDALRPICEEAGLALAGPPLPPPIIVVETVLSGAAGSDQVVFDDDERDERAEDDDHDEDEEHDEDDD